jgi:hypothetical protein
MVTVLMYLSDVEEGGETVFPKVSVKQGCGYHAKATACMLTIF